MTKSKRTRARREQPLTSLEQPLAPREPAAKDQPSAATPSELPPAPREPTAKDRKTFEARVKARLKECGLSGRKLEEKIGMARGTLSKLYSGRLGLTSRTLREIAPALGVGPDALVSDTAFHDLLRSAPTSPELEEVVEARRTIDEIRGELAEKQGRVEVLQRELLDARRESDAERTARLRDVERLQSHVHQLNVRTHTSEAALDQERQARSKLEENLREAVEQRDRYAQDLEATKQKLASLSEALTQWRTHAHERARRVQILEAELEQAATQLSQSKGQTAAAALLTGLASLGIGAAFGASSTPSRPRRR